jgi:manganese-dependent inorganic pyrophosphatase
MNETIHVIGHKNPDTDSICSAIGYAFLRNALGDAEARPARAGGLNSETRHVLKRF